MTNVELTLQLTFVLIVSEDSLILMMISYVQPHKNIKETEIIMLTMYIIEQWNISQDKKNIYNKFNVY